MTKELSFVVYTVQIKLYIGLTHGEGRPSYSPREVQRLLQESKLKTSSATLVTAFGHDRGKGEETVIVEQVWLQSEDSGLDEQCAALNNFIGSVFDELHQQRILVSFTTSRHDGKPLRTNSFMLTSDQSSIRLEDLIPKLARPAPTHPRIIRKRILVAMITVPDGRDMQALRRTGEELGEQFGGCSISTPLVEGPWKDDVVPKEQIVEFMVDITDIADARKQLRAYVREKLLARFGQRYVNLRFEHIPVPASWRNRPSGHSPTRRSPAR